MFFICLSIIVSCDDASDEDLGTTGEGTFTAKVDGNSWTSLKVSAAATISNNVASIGGSNSTGEYVRLTISSYSGIGTYAVDANSNNVLMYGTVTPSISVWIASSVIGSGTIEITEDTSTSVAGTYSFIGYNGPSDRKEITEGKFNVPKN